MMHNTNTTTTQHHQGAAVNTSIGTRAAITVDDLGLILDYIGDEIDIADEGDARDRMETLYKRLARVMRAADESPAGVDHLIIVTGGDY
jgi:hypothetical protein